ncbi:MAG: hypothetical protein CLLPBCKN_006857 [Chroococcidiopsis cubana SAG 39.79]|uniref:Pvc16 N-terminal domain-containing protein n=1 Tax=Chroococcidiopsis cubana SAG 39.79 TaxID=388085 RepID=A0AB37UIS4_9CYAN|nr:carboxypeptidase-like regulatory domain-containing protein [Chroococcidiopsis cubana]MDZ4877422.1 hypothetical protein [Chroococcidiopsis cubana SAG 39.79]PSB53856.1 hypothetical protein C7B79_35345 [Chroococcidiopsis cubana CCALA 043]RUT11239.1 hypothetical protein DSM107010_35080 [Chroococcidiopsis cubana SAG 39.79]
MLTSILQVLAENLAGGITTLTNTEQIDFSHPVNISDQNRDCLLNVYLYDIRKSKQMQHSQGWDVKRHFTEGKAEVSPWPTWFDISIIITAIDRTNTLGEYRLFYEALSFCLQHKSLPEQLLPLELQGYGDLLMDVLDPPIEIGGLWSALSAPLRPTIHLTMTVPIVVGKKEEPYLVTQRVFGMQHSSSEATKSQSTRRVSIVGIIKNRKTKEPIAEVEVALLGTEKSVTSDSQGLFSFENLRDGNYKLRLSCRGYESLNCNVLVENGTHTFKEVLLTPDWYLSIIGTIKNCKTKEPIAEVEVALLGTEKSATSDSQGLFSFESLRDGNYELRLSCRGYDSLNCNVLVENCTYTFKEILLNPV